MDNIKGLVKMVKIPNIPNIQNIPFSSKNSSEGNVNIKSLKKELEEHMNEKAKIYGFIGMEVYDLATEEKIDFPQIKNYIDKMNQLNQTINELEQKIKEQEMKNLGKNVCPSCGYKLKSQDRFCPNCGEVIPRNTILCTCGTELEKDAKFCSSCGKSMEEILKSFEKEPEPVMKECICGAKVPAGQFMCLECGRKIE